MAAAKKKQPTLPATEWIRGLLGWMIGPGRTALLLILLVGLFIGGAWAACLKWGVPAILNSPEYRISPEQGKVTPQPPWIHSDVRAEVFVSPTLDGRLSLVDDDLVERIRSAFSRHPWVAKVERVAKKYGDVTVELVYRKPVCMVEAAGKWLPVDEEAVLLPIADFTSQEITHYAQLRGIEREPVGLPGSRWTDSRVIGAAEIAAAVGDGWEPLRLRSIEPLPADPTAVVPSNVPRRVTTQTVGPALEPFFALRTDRGSQILWGYAPGAKALREIPAAEKVARLQGHVASKDSLDGPNDQAQQLDVRTMPPSVQQ
jgi:hypothetical protein